MNPDYNNSVTGSTEPVKPILSKGSCFFFHKWSMWSTYERGYKQLNVVQEYQERICLKCGKIQRKLLSFRNY